MAQNNNWLFAVNQLLINSPLGVSVGFVFIQMILEKLVELEFSCPCDSTFNLIHGLVVFIVPTIMVFLLMCAVSYSLKLWTCTCESICEALIIIIVPTITWVILMLVDGRYLACVMTDWSGKYELIENAGPQKWCKPLDSSQERDSLTKTQLWYSYSEFAGFCTALGLTVIYLVCFIGSQCSSTPENAPN